MNDLHNLSMKKQLLDMTLIQMGLEPLTDQQSTELFGTFDKVHRIYRFIGVVTMIGIVFLYGVAIGLLLGLPLLKMGLAAIIARELMATQMNLDGFFGELVAKRILSEAKKMAKKAPETFIQPYNLGEKN